MIRRVRALKRREVCLHNRDCRIPSHTPQTNLTFHLALPPKTCIISISTKNTHYKGKKQMKIKKLQHWKIINIGLLLYDILAMNTSYFLALWVRFDCRISMIPEYYMEAFLKFAPDLHSDCDCCLLAC